MRGKRRKRYVTAALCGTMLLAFGQPVSAASSPADVFDASYYAAVNPDVAAALGSDEAALYQHFVTCGMAEGRQACPWFDLAQYRSGNPDLARLFGGDNAAYYRHYLEHGMAEGRDGGGIFDPAAYAAAYPDVAAAVGNSPSALYRHFMTAGLAEGRTAGMDFNAECYAALNPDVAARCGSSEAALFREYVTEGAAQGRKGAHTDPAYRWYCNQKGEHTIHEWVVEHYTTCVDSGVQRGYCVICGADETSVDPPDGYSHVNKDADDRCDLCGARLNRHVRG